MTDLGERIEAEVARRLEVARAATPGPWTVEDAFARAAGCRCLSCWESEPYGRMIPEIDGPPRADVSPVFYEHDAAHIALHDPADAIRRYEAALRVLARHDRMPGILSTWTCRVCRPPRGPCAELLDLAASLGIEVTP